MDRLRCGVIYTNAFAEYLQNWWALEPRHHNSSIPSLEYFSCKEGPRKGEQWMTISWILKNGLEEHTLFTLGQVPLHLGKSAQRALKTKCLDIFHGSVVVRGS